MTKSKKKDASSDIVTDEMEKLVLEVQSLARVRNALSFGTKLSVRDSAESTISRKINAKVVELSKLVLKECKGE